MLSHRFATILRRYDWVFNLVFLFLGSYCVAQAGNAVLGHALQVVPSIDDQPIGIVRAPSGPAGPRRLKQIAERNLMGLKREELAGSTTAAAADSGLPPPVSGRDFVESQLHACTLASVVRATIVCEHHPDWSLAVLLNAATRETQVYGTVEGHNQITEDAWLVAVRSREIVVRRRDHFERCLGEGEGGAVVPPTVVHPVPVSDAPSEPGALVAGDMTGVTKYSETEYKVDRAELDRTLANLNEVATQARIVPSWKNGQPNGFKLFSIRPGSIYAKIGLQNGDVIQKINGFEMNSPDRALEIYTKLRDATSLTIELQRRGNNQTHNYKIQ